MGRRSSVWTELARQRERAHRQQLRLRQAEQQILRDAHAAQRQAERDAHRQEVADQREAERQFHEERTTEAARRTTDAEQRVAELTNVLARARTQPPLTIDDLRPRPTFPTFDSGPVPPAPKWSTFAPPEPGLFGRARHRRELERARAAFEAALAIHRDEQRRSDARRAEHDRAVTELYRRACEQNATIDRLAERLDTGEPEAIEEFVTAVLARAPLPSGFPGEYRVAFRPEPAELVVDVELPSLDVVPTHRAFRYVRSRREIDALAWPATERSSLYRGLIAQVVLVLLRECFAALDQRNVAAVVVNGHVSTVDSATGNPARPCLVSVTCSRQTFDGLVLDRLDPLACLRYLGAKLSPHPHDLESVEPFVRFDTAKYRIADSVDVLADLDFRTDLLQIDPYRFEQLVRQLFEAMGMQSWVTNPSRDEGVDAVAFNPDPVMGGECVIQAKRYKNVVPANDVRALGGVLDESRATRGILVTTSWFSDVGRRSAAVNNRIRLIEGGELKYLLARHLKLDALIPLRRSAPRR